MRQHEWNDQRELYCFSCCTHAWHASAPKLNTVLAPDPTLVESDNLWQNRRVLARLLLIDSVHYRKLRQTTVLRLSVLEETSERGFRKATANFPLTLRSLLLVCETHIVCKNQLMKASRYCE